jgi:hypothetical protein
MAGLQVRLFLFLFIISPLSIYARNPDDNLIKWSDSSRLKFTDFQQNIPEMDTTRYLGRGRTQELEGYIYTGIQFNYEGIDNKITYTSVAYMEPLKSWIRNANDTETLKHEQAHFDITEIYSRKFKKELQFVKSTESAKKLYNKIFIELKEEQKRFDKDHKGEEGVGLEWEKKIMEKLEELKNYSSKSIESTIR